MLPITNIRNMSPLQPYQVLKLKGNAIFHSIFQPPSFTRYIASSSFFIPMEFIFSTLQARQYQQLSLIGLSVQLAALIRKEVATPHSLSKSTTSLFLRSRSTRECIHSNGLVIFDSASTSILPTLREYVVSRTFFILIDLLNTGRYAGPGRF
jgi:hypothetical protein